MIRILLVDDEQPARDRLRHLLQAHADVEIVGEADDGEQALEQVAELHPDLVLLDIQMPGCSGLDVAASIGGGPRVVFCTAFDQHAVDAFELHAIDYLLKPVSRARLAVALDRVRAQGAATTPGAPAGARDSDATGEARVEAALPMYPTRFLGKRANRFHVVPRDEVIYFANEDGLTRLTARGQHYWMQPSLAELERHLDPAHFFRVSRAAIVRLGAIAEIVPREGGSGEARLADGTMLPVSRRRLGGLMERLARS
ncbi:MAG: LytTR family DNA-binding domain-containing protein [Vicinamibacteraceae bacterium]|nr:LytTR family DNA-binding domain-containing protein [Vicinamibacteraceae bacterium]